MKRTSRRSRGGRSPNVEYLWTGDTNGAAPTAVAAGALSYIDIATSVDYERTSTVEAGATTIVRIRGWLSFAASAVLGGIVHAGIYVHDDTINPAFGAQMDPGTFAAIRTGTCMWHFSSIPGAVADKTLVPIDVQVSRKLTAENVSFVIAARVQAITYAASFRGLLRIA